MAAVARPLLRNIPKLAPIDKWPTLFKGSRARNQLRVSVMTEMAADLAVKDMKIEQFPNRSVLEIYPGPGQLTRAMAMAGAKKVVTLEPAEMFQKSLKSLEEGSEGVIQNFMLNPVMHPYDDLLEAKETFPGMKPQPWENINTELILVGSIPNSTMGEKILWELLTASIQRMGVFRMGRVEMYMFCYQDAVKRFIAAPGSPSRNRLTITSEAAAEITPMARPGAANFHLPFDYQLLKITPYAKPKIDTSIEVFDFVLRSLFASKSYSLKRNIKLLGPGAEILLGRLSFDTDTKVKHLTIEQLNEIAVKFDQWPLRPATLYDDMILQESRKKR